MKYNLKNLIELIHDCHPDSMLEQYALNLQAELREKIQQHQQLPADSYTVKILKEILGE